MAVGLWFVACRDSAPATGGDAGASWIDADFSATLDPEWANPKELEPLTFEAARDAIWPRRSTTSGAAPGTRARLREIAKGAFARGLPNPGDATWSTVEIAETDPKTRAAVARVVHAIAAPDAPIPVAMGWDGVLRRMLRVIGPGPTKDAANLDSLHLGDCDALGAFGGGCDLRYVPYLTRAGDTARAARIIASAEQWNVLGAAMAGGFVDRSPMTSEQATSLALADWLDAETRETYDAFLRGDAAFALATGRMVLARSDVANSDLRAVVVDAARRVRATPDAGPSKAAGALEDIVQVRWAEDREGCQFDFREDPKFQEVIARGLSAVPSLIAVVERDRRLTRAKTSTTSQCGEKLAHTADAALAALEVFLKSRHIEASIEISPASDDAAKKRSSLAIRRALSAGGVDVP